MKNIQSKTIHSKRMPHFVIFMVQSERQIRGRMLCKPFYCFYDNKKIVLICFDWMVQIHCPVTNY